METYETLTKYACAAGCTLILVSLVTGSVGFAVTGIAVIIADKAVEAFLLCKRRKKLRNRGRIVRRGRKKR